MDAEYLRKFVLKTLGLLAYITFQIAQFTAIFCVSIGCARGISLAFEFIGYKSITLFESMSILSFILFIRQNILIQRLDNAFVRGMVNCFGIARPDLKFWEGVSEAQVMIVCQIILGPLLREIHLAGTIEFNDGPMTSAPYTTAKIQVMAYITCVSILLNISGGRTGCSTISRRAGGETFYCLCRRKPIQGLDYKTFTCSSILAFLFLLVPNVGIVLACAALLNGFYSVGVVLDVEPLLGYYWLIFVAVIIGFAATAIENQRPFPASDIRPPYFVFVNNLKAQAAVLHYIILPSLLGALFLTIRRDLTWSDNFRLFSILAATNIVLQIKLVLGLLRLAVEVQKRRALVNGGRGGIQQRVLPIIPPPSPAHSIGGGGGMGLAVFVPEGEGGDVDSSSDEVSDSGDSGRQRSGRSGTETERNNNLEMESGNSGDSKTDTSFTSSFTESEDTTADSNNNFVQPV